MEKKVTVLTPNGRRQNVKVTPNTILLQILEEACQKHGFDADEHCLMFHNKEVGLTQMFRFSGLPNNCLLEMCQTERKRVETNVEICVQLEDGSRKQAQFLPSDNLWHVVEKLEPKYAAEFESPVAIYMRQEIIGRETLSLTSLKSLGITEGKALIRFINKTAEELKTQANVYIAPTVKETPKNDEDDSTSNARSSQYNKPSGAGGFAITKDLIQSLKKEIVIKEFEEMATDDDKLKEAAISKPVKPKYDWGTGVGHTIRDPTESEIVACEAAQRAEREKMQEEQEIEPEVNIIGERNALIYALDSTQKPIEDLPDSFFDLTVQDLKLVLRDLKKISSGSEEAPLLTEKLRALEEQKTMLNKMAQYKNCIIRIQFPDRHVLQGMFKPIDKITEVTEFVHKFLQNTEAPFHLFTIPPKTILPLEKTLLELDVVPTAVVHFAFEDEELNTEQTVIKAEFLEKLTTIEGAIFAANKFRNLNSKSLLNATKSMDDDAVMQNYESKPPNTSTGAIPKRPRNSDLTKQIT